MINRTQNYNVSVRPAQINGKAGSELWVTLRTRRCRHREKNGGCKFCGLGELDHAFKTPLSLEEARLQITNFFLELLRIGKNPEEILKVSYISMANSVLDPKVVDPEALKAIIEITHGYLRNIKEISFESRLEWVNSTILNKLEILIYQVFRRGLVSEIAVGVETYSETRRIKSGKEITDKMIYKLSEILAEREWKLRGYFMYNMLMRDDNLKELLEDVEFMAHLRNKTGVQPAMLILRGYVPAGMERKHIFKDFKEVPDKVVLDHLQKAAMLAKKLNILFEVDPTTQDRSAVGAGVLSVPYKKAVKEYNSTLDPANLCLK